MNDSKIVSIPVSIQPSQRHAALRNVMNIIGQLLEEEVDYQNPSCDTLDNVETLLYNYPVAQK